MIRGTLDSVTFDSAKPFAVEVKRFTVPGCVITATCPCGVQHVVEPDYFSYPTANGPEQVVLCCDPGCGRDFEVFVRISLSVGPGDRPDPTLSRDTIATLLRELPPEHVAWRTEAQTSFTSRELAAEVEGGSDLGRQYGSDLLRVCRDLLARKATAPPAQV